MARVAAAIFVSSLVLALPVKAEQVMLSPPGPTISPYTAVTAKDFVAGCKVDRTSCAAVIGEVLMNRIQFSPTSHICLPDVNYADGIENWLAAHPQTGDMRADDGVYLALTTLYHCGAPNYY